MSRDDSPLFKIVRDISGGINTRQHGSIIADNQVTVLRNVDIGTVGETRKIPGLTLIEDLGNDAGTGIYGFAPNGGTAEVIATHGTKLEGWIGTSTFTEHKTDFTAGSPVTMLKAGEESENDVLLVYVPGNNWFRMTQAHAFQDLGNTAGTGSDSPPLSGTALWFRQRLWILKDNLLYYSDPFPADFSTAFNTTADAFKCGVGAERALLAIRDQGIIIIGSDAIEGINPSTTPDATDKIEKILDIGCVSGKTAVQVGDDVLFLSPDGVRGLFRSQQDKLQTGKSFPLSYNLKDEFATINWAYISKATAVYFDNKYFLALPVNSSTYNNQVWVYYPATNAWVVIDGWNVADWSKIIFSGQERLYTIDSNDGKVYRAWYGYDNNGTAITYQEEGRKEDFGKPLLTKSGGELRITALAVGDYDLDVYVEADENGYTYLGAFNLSGEAPSLPIALPFTLGAVNRKEKVFHLDSLGGWKTLRVKLVHSATNGSDEIKIYERAIITYADEYQPEYTVS